MEKSLMESLEEVANDRAKVKNLIREADDSEICLDVIIKFPVDYLIHRFNYRYNVLHETDSDILNTLKYLYTAGIRLYDSENTLYLNQ